MGYALQVKPGPAKLAEVFGVSSVEIRELSYGAMTDAMRIGAERNRASDGLLAESLHVDGHPVGLDALLALPGRLSKVIGDALTTCLVMHGLHSIEPDDDEGDEGGGDDAPPAQPQEAQAAPKQ